MQRSIRSAVTICVAAGATAAAMFLAQDHAGTRAAESTGAATISTVPETPEPTAASSSAPAATPAGPSSTSAPPDTWFDNRRKAAYDASMKSDLRTIAVEIESYFTDTMLYPDAVGAAAFTSGQKPSIATTPVITIEVGSPGSSYVYTYDATTDSYCILATNAKASHAWVYDSDQGGFDTTSPYTCS